MLVEIDLETDKDEVCLRIVGDGLSEKALLRVLSGSDRVQIHSSDDSSMTLCFEREQG